MKNIIERAVAQMLDFKFEETIGGVRLYSKKYINFVYPSGYAKEIAPLSIYIFRIKRTFKVSVWFEGNKIGEETVAISVDNLFNAVIRQAGIFYIAVRQHCDEEKCKTEFKPLETKDMF